MAGKAPPGLNLPPSAFDANAYNGTELLVTASTMLILITIFVALRFYTRCILQSTKLAWDDWLIIPAYILNLALCSLGIGKFTAGDSDLISNARMLMRSVTLYIGGVGHHIPYVFQHHPQQIPILLKCLTGVAYIFFLSELLPRLSICALYLRIFATRKTQYAIYITIAIAVANWIAYTVAFSCACRPFAFTWNRSIKDGYCYNADAFYKSLGFPSIAIDLAMIIIPIPSIYSLRLPDLHKLGVVFIFLTGSLGMVAGIIRMAVFFQADPFQGDTTWGSSELQVWTIVEPGMYLIAACLPVLRPFLSNIAPAWLKTALAKATRPKTMSPYTEDFKSSTVSPRTMSVRYEGFKSSFTHIDRYFEV